MRVVITLASLVLSASAAQAQYVKVAVSGQPMMLYQANSTNPDCTTMGAVTMRVVGGPQHGRVTVSSTGVFPTFPLNNPRSRCNTRRVAGKKAFYTSRRGYVGSDAVALEVIFPNGRYLQRSFSSAVR
jgi:hypothetical protein